MFVPTRAALGAILGLVLLAGCSAATTAPSTSAPAASTPAASTPAASASTGSSDQSVAEACTALSAAMSDAASTMQSAMSEVSSDPEKAITSLETFRDTFATATAAVGNPKVKAQAEKALEATKKMVTALETVVKDPTKASGLQSVMTDFQTEMTNMGKVCS